MAIKLLLLHVLSMLLLNTNIIQALANERDLANQAQAAMPLHIEKEATIIYWFIEQEEARQYFKMKKAAYIAQRLIERKRCQNKIQPLRSKI